VLRAQPAQPELVVERKPVPLSSEAHHQQALADVLFRALLLDRQRAALAVEAVVGQ
jgi:hypothetical protein